MYYNLAVKIPSVGGKIITKKKGEATYVLYQYGQKYYPEKKYAVPQRTIIGKVVSGSSGFMYPNKRFQEYFLNVVLPEELPEAYRNCALRIGSYAVIKKEEALTARLRNLQKQKQEYESKQIIDAFRKSGKSLAELMTFFDV